MTFSNIPTSLIIFLLIQAFWIVAFFAIIEHIIVKIIKNERWHDLVAFYTPLLKNITWLLFAIKVIYHLANVNPIVSLAVVGVVIALGWQSIRDFVQGTIFRLQKGDIRGQLLKVKNFSGVVSKMNITKIELVSNDDEIIQIPYSHIISAITAKPTATKHLTSSHILVNIPDTVSLETTKKNIKHQLLNMPWIVSSKGVKIERVNDDHQLKIVFSTLNEEYVEKVKVLLGQEF